MGVCACMGRRVKVAGALGCSATSGAGIAELTGTKEGEEKEEGNGWG